MMNLLRVLSRHAGAFFVVLLSAAHAVSEDLKPWPDPGNGEQRHVIRLPQLADEPDHMVELLLGKTLKLDERNRYFIAGVLEKRTIKGWGYSYYHLASGGQVAGTLMAVPEGAPKVDRFVTVRSDDAMIRYNSKLPLVVYVPEGFEVRYRVWSAGAESAAGKE
jgi:ecotin